MMNADAPAAEEIARKLTKAQRADLATVCRTNGGGVRITCRVLDSGEVVPARSPMRKLYDLGLIQGMSGGFARVVHTRDGLELYRKFLSREGA